MRSAILAVALMYKPFSLASVIIERKVCVPDHGSNAAMKAFVHFPHLFGIYKQEREVYAVRLLSGLEPKLCRNLTLYPRPRLASSQRFPRAPCSRDFSTRVCAQIAPVA